MSSYPVIKNEAQYKRITDIFFASLEHTGPHFYIPQYIELSKRIELEQMVGGTLGELAFPKLDEDNIVDKHFGRKSFTEDGNTVPDRLNPFEKVDVVRYHLYELCYISVYSNLEQFAFDVCKYILDRTDGIDDKETISRKLNYGGFNSCVEFLDKNANLKSEELFSTVNEELSIMRFRRNCLVHNLGIIEEHNYEKMGYQVNDIGNKVMIGLVAFLKACFHVIKTGRLIDIKMIEKYGEEFWAQS